MHDLRTLTDGLNDFRIVSAHRTGIHHGLGSMNMGGIVADTHRYAKALQALCFGIAAPIRTADYHALLMQYLSQNTHAGTADAYEMSMSQILNTLRRAESRLGWIKLD